MPLTLYRKPGESVRIAVPPATVETFVTVTVQRRISGEMTLSFDAPAEVVILRTELLERQP